MSCHVMSVMYMSCHACHVHVSCHVMSVMYMFCHVVMSVMYMFCHVMSWRDGHDMTTMPRWSHRTARWSHATAMEPPPDGARARMHL